MSEFKIGTTRIEKIHELDLENFPGTRLLPDLDPAATDNHPEWFPSGTWDAEGNALLSIHTWLVHHEGRTILIDTGAGNGKPRPNLAVLDGLHTPFLDRLAASGVAPEDVDMILLTHIHADHVGWNTRPGPSGTWLPAFPNATVVCSDREWRYGEALAANDAKRIAAIRSEAGLGDPIRTPVAGVFEDSMRPLSESGRLQRIAIDGSEIMSGIRFLPTAGHSIDHATIAVSSENETALFGGDVVHHPVELHDLDLVSCFCEFPAAARAARRKVLEHAASTGALFCSSHFPLSSAGRITRAGDAYDWNFTSPS